MNKINYFKISVDKLSFYNSIYSERLKQLKTKDLVWLIIKTNSMN